MNLVCLFWQWHWLTGRDIHSPLAWGKGWPGWGGPCWPQGIPACRVGGRRKEQAELINQKLQYWWKYLVHLHTYTHRNTLYYSQFHLRLVFLLIDYESRTTCVVFFVLCMLCWYVWRTCAQHRHKLIIKLGKESYLARQKHFFSPFSCIPNTENYLEVSCVLNQCTGSICKGKGSSECML